MRAFLSSFCLIFADEFRQLSVEVNYMLYRRAVSFISIQLMLLSAASRKDLSDY